MNTPSTSALLLCADFIAKLNELSNKRFTGDQAVPILAAMLDAHVAKERAPMVEALKRIRDNGVRRPMGAVGMKINGSECAEIARDALAKLEASR